MVGWGMTNCNDFLAFIKEAPKAGEIPCDMTLDYLLMTDMEAGSPFWGGTGSPHYWGGTRLQDICCETCSHCDGNVGACSVEAPGCDTEDSCGQFRGASCTKDVCTANGGNWHWCTPDCESSCVGDDDGCGGTWIAVQNSSVPGRCLRLSII